jgi:hypothetical protein
MPAEDIAPPGEHLNLGPLDIDLNDVRQREKRGQPVKRDRGHQLGGPDPARLSSAETVKVAGRSIAASYVKSGNSEVVRDSRRQHLDRGVITALGCGSAEQSDQHGIRFDGENVPAWAGRYSGREAEQTQIGADVPNDMPGPD